MRMKPYSECRLPTEFGVFRCLVYQESPQIEHVALVKGSLESSKPILCRIHSECLTGEVFASLKCDCFHQLRNALSQISQKENGILIYLRQEGRGIGLGNKIKAYALQEKGRDTVDANRELGFPDDSRNYQIAVQILKDLGVKSIELLTNNPNKIKALQEASIKVKRKGQELDLSSTQAHQYVKTKKGRLGHLD